MMDLTRQDDIIKPEKLIGIHVVVIGAGGIGGGVTLALAMMGISKITVFDFDEVDGVNVSSQIYGPTHIGMPKVDALKEIVKYLSGTEINTIHGRFSNELLPPDTNIVIMALDSIEARREVSRLIRASGVSVQFIIDGRMSSEILNVYSFNPSQRENQVKFAKSLDHVPPAAPCTNKAISYTTFAAASVIANFVKKFLVHGPEANIPFLFCHSLAGNSHIESMEMMIV